MAGGLLAILLRFFKAASSRFPHSRRELLVICSLPDPSLDFAHSLLLSSG
jgi:hypothetical protein